MDQLSFRKLPKYVRLAVQLRQQIQEGVFQPGDALPSLRELMRQHRVTLATVSKALDELKREGWIESVQGCGTFVKQKSCKPVVGLVMPAEAEPYASFMRTMIQAIQDAGWQPSYWPTSNAEDVALLCERKFAGMLLLPSQEGHYALIDQAWPTVLLDTVPPRPGCATVRSDHQRGACVATEHLLQQGHRRIAYVYEPDACLAQAQHRVGYHEALADAAESEGVEVNLSTLDDPAFHQVFRGEARYTAAFCCSDGVAQKLLLRFKCACYCIPRDVAVVGYYNSPLAARLCPPLTSVDPAYSQLASEATRLLQSLMDQRGTPADVVITPQLVVRASSPPPSCPHFP